MALIMPSRPAGWVRRVAAGPGEVKAPADFAAACGAPRAPKRGAQHAPNCARLRLARAGKRTKLVNASRRGEVVRLGPQHVKHGRIRIERTHGSEDVDMPVSPQLQAACDAMPKAHLTYIVSAYGKPRSK